VIFDYVRVLFYDDDMKLFLSVRGFQDSMKIQLINILCPVEFSFNLARTVLSRLSSINDLGVIMDEKMNFSEHVDVMLGKAFAMLLEDFHSKFKDLYSLKCFYTFLVRPKMEYANCVCVWNLFYVCRYGLYDIRYALRSLSLDGYSQSQMTLL
jgi:hypothetical protein